MAVGGAWAGSLLLLLVEELGPIVLLLLGEGVSGVTVLGLLILGVWAWLHDLVAGLLGLGLLEVV